MRNPEAWQELGIIIPEYLEEDILSSKPPNLAQMIRDHKELLASITFLTGLQFGGTLMMIGDETWQNIGASIVVGTVTIPVGALLAVKTNQVLHSVMEHTRSFIGEYIYDSFKHFHQP